MFSSSPQQKAPSPSSPAHDSDLSIELIRAVLKPIGAWPCSTGISQTENRTYRYLNVLIAVFCYVLIGSIFVSCALYIILDIQDTYQRMYVFAPLNFCFTSLFKYSSLKMRNREIRKCVEYIENDWRETTDSVEQTIMIQNAMFGRKLIKICAVFMYGGVCFYFIVRPIVTGKTLAADGNFTYWTLSYPITRSILDARRSPVNEVLLVVQCATGLLVHSITLGGFCLAAAFAMHAYGQLELVMCWLRQFVDGKANACDSESDRLASIVKKHVKVLRFITLTKKIVNQISVFELWTSTSSMCLNGYYILAEWEDLQLTQLVMYFTLGFSVLFTIFIFCYTGEVLMEQWKKVAEIAYMIEWYRLPGKRSISVVFIIAMSNTSVKLTAGNIIDLCLASFGDVIKTTVVYLNMLRTLTFSE